MPVTLCRAGKSLKMLELIDGYLFSAPLFEIAMNSELCRLGKKERSSSADPISVAAHQISRSPYRRRRP